MLKLQNDAETTESNLQARIDQLEADNDKFRVDAEQREAERKELDKLLSHAARYAMYRNNSFNVIL